mgnify:CR=1 FL=1
MGDDRFYYVTLNKIGIGRNPYIYFIITTDLYVRCLKGVLHGNEFVSEMGECITIPGFYTCSRIECFVLLDKLNHIMRMVPI